MAYLATELIGAIFSWICIEFTPDEFSEIFRNCCLVSRTWRAIAQPFLFTEFPLRCRYYNQAAFFKTLLQLFAKRMALARL